MFTSQNAAWMVGGYLIGLFTVVLIKQLFAVRESSRYKKLIKELRKNPFYCLDKQFNDARICDKQCEVCSTFQKATGHYEDEK